MARIGVGLHDRVELAEDLALEVEVLGHRLDDEVAVGQVLERGGEPHAGRCSAAWSLRRQLAAGDGPVGRVPQDAAAVLERRPRWPRPPTTSRPLRANTSTMPAPMVPRPMTPTSAEVPCHARSLSEPPDTPGGIDRESVVTSPCAAAAAAGPRVTGSPGADRSARGVRRRRPVRRRDRPAGGRRTTPPGRARGRPAGRRGCGPGACTPWAWASTRPASSPRSRRCAPCRCSWCSRRSPRAWP